MHASHIWVFVTLWTVARQAPLSMGFSWQEYWSGLPFPSPGDLPDPRIEPTVSCSSCIGKWILYHGAIREAHKILGWPGFLIFFQCFQSLIPPSLASWFWMRNWLLILLIIACTWWVAPLTAFKILPCLWFLNTELLEIVGVGLDNYLT